MPQQTNCILLPTPTGMTHPLHEWESRYNPSTGGIGELVLNLIAPKFGTCRVLSTTHHFVGSHLRSGNAGYRRVRVSFFIKTKSKKDARYFPEDADFCLEAIQAKNTKQIIYVSLWAKAPRPKLKQWAERAALIHKLSSP